MKNVAHSWWLEMENCSHILETSHYARNDCEQQGKKAFIKMNLGAYDSWKCSYEQMICTATQANCRQWAREPNGFSKSKNWGSQAHQMSALESLRLSFFFLAGLVVLLGLFWTANESNVSHLLRNRLILATETHINTFFLVTSLCPIQLPMHRLYEWKGRAGKQIWLSMGIEMNWKQRHQPHQQIRMHCVCHTGAAAARFIAAHNSEICTFRECEFLCAELISVRMPYRDTYHG